MGRWLVILSLAVVQCSDAVMASSTDVPVWRKLFERARLEIVPTARSEKPTGSQAQQPVSQPQAREPITGSQALQPAAESQAQESVSTPGAPQSIAEWEAHQPVAKWPSKEPDAGSQTYRPIAKWLVQRSSAGWQVQATSNGTACSGGRRIISAFYSQGRRTASGQLFDPRAMTAAHRTLPFGTRLTVTNPRTGKSVIVVVNDRGPFVSGVSLDLTLGAAQAIGMHGTGSVCIW
jgi:rare lipoprotein A (peptidoglycan hydrolase)